LRRFVIVGHKAVTNGDFKLDDMAGGAGRLDILLRCINSAFFLSHKLRRDVEVYLVLQGPPNPPRTVRLVGNELKYLNPDERSTGALVRNALLQTGEREMKSSPGIYISDRSFVDVINGLAEKSRIIYLKEDGNDVRDKKFEGDVTFVLSDHNDLTSEEESQLMRHIPGMICLGPISYHADHCIIIMNNELDRRCEGSIGEMPESPQR
jgi:tRNA (pseudouridine54-N1)-methyltransferase